MKLFTTRSMDYLEQLGHDFWKETLVLNFWPCGFTVHLFIRCLQTKDVSLDSEAWIWKKWSGCHSLALSIRPPTSQTKTNLCFHSVFGNKRKCHPNWSHARTTGLDKEVYERSRRTCRSHQFSRILSFLSGTNTIYKVQTCRRSHVQWVGYYPGLSFLLMTVYFIRLKTFWVWKTNYIS